MPWQLQSAGEDKYFVVDDKGKKYSDKPLPKWRASVQMRALYASEAPKKEKHLEGQHDQRAHGSWAQGGEYETKFDADKWNAMGFQEKRDAWNALSAKDQDTQADPTKSIPAYQNELLKDAGARPNLNKNDVKISIDKRLSQIGDLIPTTTTDEIRIISTGLDDLLSMAGVKPAYRHEIAMEAIDALAAQDYESAGRVLGDHGIAHISGNINFASEILQQHPGADDPGEMAGMVVAQIFHDTGYMAPPSRNFLDEQHPRWSTQHYDKNIRPLIEKAMGDREASDIGHMISTHFETSIDWENDLKGTAVRVADNLALFQKEKLPPVLRLIPDNISVIENLGQKKIDLKTAQSQMSQNIAKSGFSDRFKESLNRAANELTPVTPKFVLGMLGGNILRFQWAGDHLKVVLGRNAQADRLQRILDLGQKQFAKYAKVYGIDPDQFLKDLNFQFKNKTTGQILLEAEVAEEKSRSKGWHGRGSRNKHLPGAHDQASHGIWAQAMMGPDKGGGGGGGEGQTSMFGGQKPASASTPPKREGPAPQFGLFGGQKPVEEAVSPQEAWLRKQLLNATPEAREAFWEEREKPILQEAKTDPWHDWKISQARKRVTDYNDKIMGLIDDYKREVQMHPDSGWARLGKIYKQINDLSAERAPFIEQLEANDQLRLDMPGMADIMKWQVVKSVKDFLERLDAPRKGTRRFISGLPAFRIKHLAGQHPQERHGWRYGRQSMGQARRISGQGSAEWQEYKKRARGRGEIPGDIYDALVETKNRIRNINKTIKDPKEKLHALSDLQESVDKKSRQVGWVASGIDNQIAKERLNARKELDKQKKEGGEKAPGPTAYGGTAVAYGTDAHKIYEFKYRLMELDDMVTSNSPSGEINPDYDQALQPRIRSRQASEGQINTIASDLNPDRLLTDFHKLDEGPMIVGADNMVEAGNGRTLALDKARKEFPEQWDKYQGALKDRLDDYGMTEEDIKGMKAPVLVRERVTDVPDRAKFAAETNQRTTLDMSPLEQALADVKIIDDKSLSSFKVEEDQTIESALRSQNNTAFVQSFVGSLPENERAALLRGDGSLNRMGLWRIKAAVFSRVFPGEAGQRLADTYLESLDPGIKNFENAMSASLPQMAKAEWLIGSGQRKPALSLARDFAKAIDMLARLKEQGIPVPDYLSQIQMFGKELNNRQLSLLKKFDSIARKPKTLREFFRKYANLVAQAPNPKQVTSSVFGNIDISPDDLLNSLLTTDVEELIPAGQVGLFAGVQQ